MEPLGAPIYVSVKYLLGNSYLILCVFHIQKIYFSAFVTVVSGDNMNEYNKKDKGNA